MALETPTASQTPTQLSSLVRYQGGPTSSLLSLMSEPAKPAIWTAGEGCPRSLEPYFWRPLIRHWVSPHRRLRECNTSRFTRNGEGVQGGDTAANASHLAFDLHPHGKQNTCHGGSGTSLIGTMAFVSGNMFPDVVVFVRPCPSRPGREPLSTILSPPVCRL